MEYNFNENAYQEAYEIINFLVDAGEIVVPQKTLDVLEKGRNINHSFNLNDINRKTLHPDTEKILTSVYLECIATNKEKSKINKAVKVLRKTIIQEEGVKPVTSLATITWSDKIRAKLMQPVKIKI